MAEQIQISALIRPELDTGGIVKKISSIQALLKKVNLPPSLQREFDGLFTDFNSSIEKINGQFSKGFETKGAVKSLDSMSAEMRSTVEKIAQAWQQVSSKGDLIKLPPDQDKKLKQINIEIQQLRTKINQVNPKNLEQVTQAIDQLKGKAGQKTGSEVMELIDQGEAQQAINLLDIIIAKREKMSLTTAESKAGDTFRADTLALTQMRDALLNAETETKDLVTQLEQLDADGAKILTQAMDSFNKEIKETKTDTESLNQGLENTEHSMRSAAQGAQEMSSEMDEIKNRIKYFFSLNNAIQLVRQALRQTFEAAKELDAAMTETAVVTDFSVGDMWDMLPEYTKTAQELGATTKGVYETLTLFYQQGLDTNEAMALGVETLKMARIAGMDYEEATSKMTAALRGFNMELDEASAKRVNDVYSELAAITAADTDQIATAMTKTASIANSANMEFETTAAFLSQIIETTQESAETAGTAMKTVIARFTELKKDPSLIGEVDGEVIDANKIETALNSIGVALRDNLTGQFRDLDDVFLDIAQKWEGLNTNTQRYIATIAAGSRQQSRFIAMMSDYERTMELVNAANNSAGSSQAQFDKTLESMEAKLNQLKNTWQEFTLGLMDQGLLKGLIEALNGLLGAINKLTDAPGILGSASKAFLSFFLLFTGKKLFNVFEGVLSSQIKSFQSGGKVAAITWGQSFNQEFKKTKIGIQKNFKGLFSFTGKDGKALASFIPKGAAKQFNDLAVAQEKANQSTSLLNKAMVKYGVTSDQLENLETANITTIERRVLTQLKLRSAFDSNDVSQAREILEQTGVAKAYDLSNDQMMEYLGIKKLGISTDLAAAAAKAGVTMAQLKENAATALGIPLDRELTAEEEKQLAVEMRNQLLRQQGILVRLKEKVIKVGSIAITKLETAATKDNTAGIIANWLAQKLRNKEMLAGTVIIAAVVAAIALLVAGVVALVKAYQNWAQQGELAAQRTANAKKEAEEAAQAYDDLKSSIEKLKGLEDNLKGLEEGTAEWKKTVAELNQEVLKLLETYPFLSQYISNSGGILSIDAAGYDAILTHQANQVQQTSAIAASSWLAEQEIKKNTGDDIFTSKLKEFSEQLSIYAEKQTVYSSLDNTSYGSKIHLSGLEGILQNYLKGNEITIEDLKQAFYNDYDDAYHEIAFDTDSLNLFLAEIPNLALQYQELIEVQNQYKDQLIQAANDLISWGGTPEPIDLLTQFKRERMDDFSWTDRDSGREVKADNDDEVWTEYVAMLNNKDSTYEYEVTNKKLGNATVSRTKNGVTEYQTSDGSWTTEKQTNKVSQRGAFEQVRTYKMGHITDDEINEFNGIMDQFEGKLTEFGDTVGEIDITNISDLRDDLIDLGYSVDFVDKYLKAVDLPDGTNLGELNDASANLARNEKIIVAAEIENKDQLIAELNEKFQNEENKLVISNFTFDPNSKHTLAEQYEIFKREFEERQAQDVIELEVGVAIQGDEDLNQEEIVAYANTLMETANASDLLDDSLSEQPKIAAKVAVAMTKMDKGLKELAEGFEEWNKLIKENEVGTPDYTKGINGIRKALANMLGMEENLISSSFVEDHLNEIERAANGDKEAIDELQIVAGKETLINVGINNLPQSEIQSFIDQVNNLEIPDIEVGATIDDTSEGGFIDCLDNLIKNAGLTQTQVNEILGGMGFEATYAEEPAPVTNEQQNYATRTSIAKAGFFQEDAGGKSFFAPYIDTVTTTVPTTKTIVDGTIGVPAMTTDGSAPSPKIKSLTKVSSGGLTSSSSRGSGGSGGGGGSGNKTKKSPKADPAHNVKQKITSTQEKRNKLEKEYEKILEDEVPNLEAARQNLAEQLKLLELEHNLLLQRKQIHKESLEQAIKDYSKYSEYFWYDSQIGKVMINNSAIDAITDEDLRSEVEEAQKEMEGFVNEIVETDNSIYDVEGQITDLRERGKNDLDEQLNKVEKINELEKKRNKISSDLNLLQNERKLNEKEYLETLDKEREILEENIKQAKELKQLREQDLIDFIKELESNGYLEYMSYNFSTRETFLDKDKIDTLSQKQQDNILKAFDELTKKSEDYENAVEDEIEAIEENSEALKERRKSAISAVEYVRDLLIEAREREIEFYQEISDSIGDSNSRIIESINETLSRQREQRDNAETEADLNDMRNRLAYLQMDTSGANQNEILNLQKQVLEKEEDYTDTLIDQKISELEKQNDEAAEQRERQITLMEWQLQNDQDSGAITKNALLMLQNGLDENGVIISGSPLDKLINESGELKGLSNLEKLNILNTISADLVKYFDYMTKDRLVGTAESGFEIGQDVSSQFGLKKGSAKITGEGEVTFGNGYKISGITAGGWNDMNLSFAEGTDYQKLYANAATAREVMRAAIGLSNVSGLTDPKAIAKKMPGWDANKDGTITSADARDILRASVGLENLNNKFYNEADLLLLLAAREGASESEFDKLYKETVGQNPPKGTIDSKVQYFVSNLLGKAKKYATGGLADYTGPAWLDGTKSRPELVLNQKDTQNFLRLKDVLSQFMSNNNFKDKSSENSGDNYYEIHLNVEKITSDYDVEQLANKVKSIIAEDANSRGVNSIYRRR